MKRPTYRNSRIQPNEYITAYGTRSCRKLTQDNNHLDCGECNVCAAYCDVCGVWYSLDEPCEFH